MSGINLEAIHRALADKIRAGVSTDTNVTPFPGGITIYPQITVYPGSPYIEDYFDTFGPNGYMTINLRLKVEVDADPESMGIKICRYLNVGTGNTSSIMDATMATNHTLGGTVEECVITGNVEWNWDADPGTVWIPVRIVAKKTSAGV